MRRSRHVVAADVGGQRDVGSVTSDHGLVDGPLTHCCRGLDGDHAPIGGFVGAGAGPDIARLVREGWIDVLFAGNALATHDIESALYGTSLGVDLAMGQGVEHGHEHHIRAINQIRKAGSIAKAVESGMLTSGVMHALVKNGKEFVLVGWSMGVQVGFEALRRIPDRVRGMMAPWVLHSGLGPDDACSALIGKLTFAAVVAGGMPVVKGGGQNLVRALCAIIEKAGGRIQLNTEVEEIVLEKVAEYHYPVCFDFPVGHQRANFALKCGVQHRLHITPEAVTLTEIL